MTFTHAMCPRAAVLLLLALAGSGAEVVWEDTPALTNIWQAVSSGEAERLFDVLSAGRAAALERSADGRGPLFWAYEFKNVDALALLLHLDADEDAEDADGKRPSDFFPDGEAALKEFAADAEGRADEAVSEFKAREQEA